jgi:subtilisin family serine protease
MKLNLCIFFSYFRSFSKSIIIFSNNYIYISTGSTVNVYVVDTGINSTSQDFSGRVLPGWSGIDGSTTDCNGHGTHVSGTIGGTTYGVAKNVNLIPVRVFNCTGSTTNTVIISGLDWIVGHHRTEKAVVNMSLGGGASSALDTAVNSLIGDGVVVVVAAGNSKIDACNSSPARVPNAITVAASDSTDTFASYSNYGRCVDIIAPGSAITSNWWTSPTAIKTISGTSMASPHVAGAVARYLSSSPTPSTNTSVAVDLQNASTRNAIKRLKLGTFNYLLYIDPAK